MKRKPIVFLGIIFLIGLTTILSGCVTQTSLPTVQTPTPTPEIRYVYITITPTISPTDAGKNNFTASDYAFLKRYDSGLSDIRKLLSISSGMSSQSTITELKGTAIMTINELQLIPVSPQLDDMKQHYLAGLTLYKTVADYYSDAVQYWNVDRGRSNRASTHAQESIQMANTEIAEGDKIRAQLNLNP